MNADATAMPRRVRIEVSGAVQGVGFRPFAYRLAAGEGLVGFVMNTSRGATIEAEGSARALDRFVDRLRGEAAFPLRIESLRSQALPLRGERAFVIAPSEHRGVTSATVSPDLATCPDCLAEIFDPGNRRHRYPFTTCVHCGPRYSIVESIPYDRARTTMRGFDMCPACRAEYDDPASRRFHAETIACPDCGPKLTLWDRTGKVVAMRDDALAAAADALRQGRVVALKGLGGFQLIADARDEAAVARLRAGKRRPSKPFAIMVADIAAASALAHLADCERDAIAASAAPIVLLRARPAAQSLAASVASGSPLLGIMLPCTPLHHLLLRDLGFPIVATSGNRGDEPIEIDEREALTNLFELADLFLVHDRPIHRRVDDSVVRAIAGQPTVLRLARGYAPLEIACPAMDAPLLALGGHQKAALAIASGGRLVLGPHIGDLNTDAARLAFTRSTTATTGLYATEPAAIACDTHPAYYTSRVAVDSGLAVHRAPHHLAHVLAGMADNGLSGAMLGVAWDGTGHGADGTIWGGEFLVVDDERYRRVAHFKTFRLPGGEVAVREPRRAALGALHAIDGGDAWVAGAWDGLAPCGTFSRTERRSLATMLARGVNAPLTSSVGRLFDAVAAILGVTQVASFEGEAAMAVEFAADRADAAFALDLPIFAEENGRIIVDWRPALVSMIAALRRGAPIENLCAGFHDMLAAAILGVAERIGVRRVLLTGGCFQNARLSECAIDTLRRAGFEPFRHTRIPPNDGGLAAGQAVFAARPLIDGDGPCV